MQSFIKKDIIIISILSVLFGIFIILYAGRSPIFLGDVYEYAVITKNLIERGGFREDYLRSYIDPDLELPHPAGQRANLYPIILIPFYLIFNEPYLVVLLPALLSHIFLAIVVYFFGLRFFNPKIALFSTILVLLHPRLLYHISFDPHPEILLSAFFLLAILSFLKRKYIHAGVFSGLSFLTKMSSMILLPAFFLWLILFCREELKKRSLWMGLLVALIVCSPFMIRNMIVFGNPVYNETLKDMKNWSPEDREAGDRLKFLYNFKDEKSQDHQPKNKSFVDDLRVIRTNAWHVLFGETTIDYYPGFLEIIFPVLIPFFFIGLYIARKNKDMIFVVIVIFSLLSFHLTILRGYEDRYLFPILPLVICLSLNGLFFISKRIRLFNLEFIILFLIISELIVVLPMSIYKVAYRDDSSRHGYHEFKSCCKWIKDNSKSDAVIMAANPSIAGFITDRSAVPYPYGDLRSLKSVIDKYKVDFTIIGGLLDYKEFPFLDFMPILFRGKTVSIHRTNRDSPSFHNLEKKYSYMLDFNPLGNVFERTKSRGIYGPEYSLFRNSIHFAGGKWMGVSLYILILILYSLLLILCGLIIRRYKGQYIKLASYCMVLASAPFIIFTSSLVFGIALYSSVIIACYYSYSRIKQGFQRMLAIILILDGAFLALSVFSWKGIDPGIMFILTFLTVVSLCYYVWIRFPSLYVKLAACTMILICGFFGLRIGTSGDFEGGMVRGRSMEKVNHILSGIVSPGDSEGIRVIDRAMEKAGHILKVFKESGYKEIPSYVPMLKESLKSRLGDKGMGRPIYVLTVDMEQSSIKHFTDEFPHALFIDKVDKIDPDAIYIRHLNKTGIFLKDNESIRRAISREEEKRRLYREFKDLFQGSGMRVERTDRALMAY